MSDAKPSIRVLAIDGDADRHERYRRALAGITDQTFSLIPAESGDQGLALVQTARPDVVIVSLALPDMEAASVVAGIGRSEAKSGPAVVATVPTAAREPEALAMIAAGADDFLVVETLSPAQMCRALGRAIEIVSLRRLVANARQACARLGFDDPLTGLATRSLFHNRLIHALNFAKRNDQNLCLMLIELNQLREINLTLGHQAGDQALRETARRLKTALREADTVARTNGNRFGALLQTSATYEGSKIAAEKILRALGQPFKIDGRPVNLNPDIGIALFPNHGDSDDTLVHHAETAMRQARRRGGGYAVFTYDDLLSDFLDSQPSAA